MSAFQLKTILLKSGRYYRSAALFYHELWREHLRQMGFVVISVEKLDAHDLWVIRLRITSSAQLNLLFSSARTDLVLAVSGILRFLFALLLLEQAGAHDLERLLLVLLLAPPILATHDLPGRNVQDLHG